MFKKIFFSSSGAREAAHDGDARRRPGLFRGGELRLRVQHGGRQAGLDEGGRGLVTARQDQQRLVAGEPSAMQYICGSYQCCVSGTTYSGSESGPYFAKFFKQQL